MDNQLHGNDGIKMKPIARPSLGKAAPKAQIPALGGFSGIGKGLERHSLRKTWMWINCPGMSRKNEEICENECTELGKKTPNPSKRYS